MGALVASGLVENAADLFRLRKQDLVRIAHYGEKSAQNLVDAIERGKHTELRRFLHALGMPGVGARTAQELADRFGTLEALLAADEEELQRAPGIGPAVAAGVAEFLRRSENRRVIALCIERGGKLAHPGLAS